MGIRLGGVGVQTLINCVRLGGVGVQALINCIRLCGVGVQALINCVRSDGQPSGQYDTQAMQTPSKTQHGSKMTRIDF